MLSSRGCGKYLDSRWAEQREQAARDKDTFTSDQLAYLEVSTGYPVKGDGDARDETYKQDSVSLDVNPISGAPNSVSGALDIRGKQGRA